MISTDQPLELSGLASTREVKAVLKLRKKPLKIRVRRFTFQLQFVPLPAESAANQGSQPLRPI